MSRITETNLLTGVLELSKYTPKEEVKKLLEKMVDSDFSGNNGEEYYIEVNGEKMSRLDACLLDFKEMSDDFELVEFINDVLENNYSDGYYVHSKVEVFQVENSIVACVSFIA